jgi:acyl carrier protein
MQTNNSNSNIEKLQYWLINQLAEHLSLEPNTINVNEPLTRYGLDSIDAVTMVGDLEDWLDLELPSTLFWDYPTIAKSAHYLAENFDLSTALKDSDSSETPQKSQDAEPVKASAGKGWGGLFGKK